MQLHALHKGESSAKAGDKFLCAALHIGSDIFAVGAGIGQKPFFIKGLRIVKGLFRRKPIQTVCFPLQGGEVKQFRRGSGLFLFFKGSTNGLRFLASRFHLPRRRFVVLPFGKGGNAANVQPDDMIFLFLKAADCIVAVYQHSKGGRLHSADIQCFMVEDREKAGRVNANEPIGLCSAKRGLIEVVIAAPVFEIREALADCACFHAANPKAGKGLFAIRLFIDKAENEFSLAPAVASIDNLGNVAAVHKVFEDRKLLLLAAGNNKLPLLRDNGEIVILPFSVLLVVGGRVRKANQMPDTPRHKIAAAFKISAALFIRAQYGGNRRPDARFFCNYKFHRFSSSCSVCSVSTSSVSSSSSSKSRSSRLLLPFAASFLGFKILK